MATGIRHPPFTVYDSSGVEVQPVTEFLKQLALSDCSSLTCRSYAFGLLRWFRLLWLLDVAWDRATEAEVGVLVGWLRTAENPQRNRRSPNAHSAGSTNPRTGKTRLAPGYAPRTINHALSVVSGFYAHHLHYSARLLVNPVPVSRQRRRALAHLSPLEPKPPVRRARLRQKVADCPPRAIPDVLWDELFGAIGNDRDRALLEFFVSSGARAQELLGVQLADVDWARQFIYVISKGSRARQAIPASPQAFTYLAAYFRQFGVPPPGTPIWRTIRGAELPLTYSALRRILQRANARVGTNWTLHDLRHTACSRMANGGQLTLPEVQAIMRHANIQTTGQYLAVQVETLVEKLFEHFSTPKPRPVYDAGYDPADVEAVFGAQSHH